jgi:hypothetical protein
MTALEELRTERGIVGLDGGIERRLQSDPARRERIGARELLRGLVHVALAVGLDASVVRLLRPRAGVAERCR